MRLFSILLQPGELVVQILAGFFLESGSEIFSSLLQAMFDVSTIVFFSFKVDFSRKRYVL